MVPTKMPASEIAPVFPGRFLNVGSTRGTIQGLLLLANPYAPAPRPNLPGVPTEETAPIAGPAIIEMRSQAARMAGVDLPVLLLGGSTTVRDGVARLIHRLSPRHERPFAQINCGGFSPRALERKLFGCEIKTHFGTVVPKLGLFESCQGGTVLLGDITAMPGQLQARLVDLLDEHWLCRMDGRKRMHVDVRILASTSMEIASALMTGRLRQDLYQRLDTLVLHLPNSGEGQVIRVSNQES